VSLGIGGAPVGCVLLLSVRGERLREPCATGGACIHTAINAASVYKVTTYPTRLETRIAEFSV
jgi:hypothetical protein